MVTVGRVAIVAEVVSLKLVEYAVGFARFLWAEGKRASCKGLVQIYLRREVAKPASLLPPRRARCPHHLVLVPTYRILFSS